MSQWLQTRIFFLGLNAPATHISGWKSFTWKQACLQSWKIVQLTPLFLHQTFIFGESIVRAYHHRWFTILEHIKGKTWSTMSNIIYNVNVHLRIIFSHVFLLLLSFTTQISPSKIPLNTGAYKSLHWYLFFSEKKSVLTATKENWYRWNMMIKSVTKLLIAM